MPRPAPPLPSRAADHIRRQCGLLTRSQALGAGVPAWQIEGFLRREQWSRVLPSVYLTNPGKLDDLGFIRAAQLWAGPDSIVTGAAALFWQRRSDAPLDRVDLATPNRLRVPELKPRIVAHRQRIHDFWIAYWNGIRVARTEFAIAQLLPVQGPELLDNAVRRRWVSVEMVLEAHRALGVGRGSVARAQILRAAEGGAESEAERLLHRALRDAGITGWVANAPVRLGLTNRVGDIVFPGIKLLVEVDGFAFHTSHERFAADRARQNEFAIAGWTVLRFTWWQLRQEPDRAVREIRAAIQQLSG
ncbi:endonuclease domain-containing protein [Nakamurella sp.]|uniref:endonuclease domain-containing protein n=1 Tax=Nakamurella sp. TaxID=1869182 RepID=UPI003782E32F